MKANVHEFIVFLISISACSLRKPMFTDKSDSHQVGLWKHPRRRHDEEATPVVEHLLVDCQPPSATDFPFNRLQTAFALH
jgi:hypothetical protein